ncbi:MAG: glycosyltransferase family 2 protein [Pseudomonadota bacterium]
MGARKKNWPQGDGTVPVAVIMISLNEAHNMEAVLENLRGWAHEVFLVDSYSSDATVSIALEHGVHVVQRRFNGFGDQWNWALDNLPVTSDWTMKLDPDERLTDELKASIGRAVAADRTDALSFTRRLWFMGKPLPVSHPLLRVWRTGRCRFSDVLVNEHPKVDGTREHIAGELEHHDSPHLHHWYEKQNAYSTAEATSSFRNDALADEPRLFGTPFQRRMWLKRNYRRLPFRYTLIFLYCLLVQGAWKAGRVGVIWARLRSDVYRMRDYKRLEMQMQGKATAPAGSRTGEADNRVEQFA